MFKKLSTVALCAIAIRYFSSYLDSSSLFNFLDTNLILLLVTLAAINNTTLGVVMTKLREISKAYHSDFSSTIKEMRGSIIEQIILILVSVIVQILSGSSFLFVTSEVFNTTSQVILISVFFYALYTLYDTANMIFVILEFENDEIKKENDKAYRDTAKTQPQTKTDH